MSIFQILAVLFALFMIYWARSNQKRKNLSLTESSFWYSIWLVFIVLSIFPNLLLGIADSLHFARVFDLLIVSAFMVLTVLNFYNYTKTKKVEEKLETMARKITLKNK